MTTGEHVMAALADGPATAGELATSLRKSSEKVYGALSRAHKAGKVKKRPFLNFGMDNKQRPTTLWVLAEHADAWP